MSQQEHKTRAVVLTEKALEALGVQPSRLVPLLDLPWRDDAKDRRGGQR